MRTCQNEPVSTLIKITQLTISNELHLYQIQFSILSSCGKEDDDILSSTFKKTI